MGEAINTKSFFFSLPLDISTSAFKIPMGIILDWVTWSRLREVASENSFWAMALEEFARDL